MRPYVLSSDWLTATRGSNLHRVHCLLSRSFFTLLHVRHERLFSVVMMHAVQLALSGFSRLARPAIQGSAGRIM
jgi:hypothetical protein